MSSMTLSAETLEVVPPAGGTASQAAGVDNQNKSIAKLTRGRPLGS